MSKSIIRTPLTLLLATLLLTLASPALAYIGPGAGISVLGSLLGILATIVVAIGAIIFWPLRKFMKRRKARRDSLASVDAGTQGVDATHKSGNEKSDATRTDS